MEINRKHIVIIGAGFAGLKIARKLNNHPAYAITLLDKNNYHQFQPLFYQVAMANLDASNISFPLRNIFEKSKNVAIRVATVTSISTETNTVATEKENFTYDYLVIATGATTNFFDNDSIKKNAFPMKSTLEALQIRNTLLQHFEDAVSKSEKLLSVVIVGGGPTGVELSGALAEMKNDSLPFEYPELDFTKMKVYLLEGTGKLLANMSSNSSRKAHEYLTKLGVTVLTNAIVKSYDGKKLLLDGNAEIESSFVIWAAGVKGNIPHGIRPELITKANQVKTDMYNRVISFNNVFAVGDIAFMDSKLYPKGFPQLASVAIDQAKNVAENFIRLANQKTIQPFKYVNKGSMATVGRNKAVVDLANPKLFFQGFFAWIIWMTLHLFLLIGFKNRIIVFINWIYKYITHHQSLALMFEPLARKTSACDSDKIIKPNSSTMKTEQELTEDILKLTMSIKEEYPELSKFIEEMTVTIPDEKKPEIDVTHLKNYYSSLIALVDGYCKKNAIKPSQKIGHLISTLHSNFDM